MMELKKIWKDISASPIYITEIKFLINLFHGIGLFLYLLKTESQKFKNV